MIFYETPHLIHIWSIKCAGVLTGSCAQQERNLKVVKQLAALIAANGAS